MNDPLIVFDRRDKPFLIHSTMVLFKAPRVGFIYIDYLRNVIKTVGIHHIFGPKATDTTS